MAGTSLGLMHMPFVYSIHRQYDGFRDCCTSAPLLSERCCTCPWVCPWVTLGALGSPPDPVPLASGWASSPPRCHLPSPSPCRLGVQNQASISSLWALCADILDAEAGTRLFGFIGAGKKGVGADGPL